MIKGFLWSPRGPAAADVRPDPAEPDMPAATSEEAECASYPSAAIRIATSDYDPSLLIGRGAYASVYGGELSDRQVAVKRIDGGTQAADEDAAVEAVVDPDVALEVVRTLGGLRHPHLVPLLGYCDDEGEWSLVYERVDGGDLKQKLLASAQVGRKPFSWVSRMQIASQIAHALLYLHSQQPPIIHGDLKPANILLRDHASSNGSSSGISSGSSALVSDAGLPMLLTGFKGTAGYIDPYQIVTGDVSPVSDLFSFGVVILQLMSGMAHVLEVHDILDSCCVGEARLMNLTKATRVFVDQLDESAGLWSVEHAEVLITIALRCVQQSPGLRPLLAEEIVPRLAYLADKAQQIGSDQPEVAPIADLSLSRSRQVHRNNTTGPATASNNIGNNSSKASTAVMHRPPRPSTPNQPLTPSAVPRSSSFAHGDKNGRRLHSSQGRLFGGKHSKLSENQEGGGEDGGEPKVPPSPTPSTDSSTSGKARKGSSSPWGFSVRNMFKSTSAPNERVAHVAGEESPRTLLSPSLWKRNAGAESPRGGGQAEAPAGPGEKGIVKEGLHEKVQVIEGGEELSHEELRGRPRRGRKGFNSMFGLDG